MSKANRFSLPAGQEVQSAMNLARTIAPRAPETITSMLQAILLHVHDRAASVKQHAYLQYTETLLGSALSEDGSHVWHVIAHSRIPEVATIGLDLYRMPAGPRREITKSTLVAISSWRQRQL